MTEDTTTQDAGGLSIRLETLGTMNQLGETGVAGVSDRLRQLDDGGAEVVAERAKAGFVSRDGLAATFGEDKRVAVRVGLSTAPGGQVLVVFDMASANRAATLLLSNAVDDLDRASNELAHSAVKELGGMIAYGFVDALADAVGREIDVGRPVLLNGEERAIVARTLRRDEGLGLYIASRLSLPAHDVETSVYLFPDSETMIETLEGFDGDGEGSP